MAVEKEVSKADLTKFLEELIDQHPDAMDAIENVREKRRREGGEKLVCE